MVMEEAIRKSAVLIEAMPYIRAFQGKVFVIKFGGAAMEDDHERTFAALAAALPPADSGQTAFDPDGVEVAVEQTQRTGDMAMPITVGEGQDGRAWSLTTEGIDEVAFEDYTVKLDPALPPYWSLAADRLVLPAE